MKLSKKGFHKVLQTCRFDEDRATYVLKYSDALKDHFFEVEETEFESDDFENVVCLTVDEAKAVLECVDSCAFPSPFEGFVSKIILLQDKLKKRIEKAEGK